MENKFSKISLNGGLNSKALLCTYNQLFKENQTKIESPLALSFLDLPYQEKKQCFVLYEKHVLNISQTKNSFCVLRNIRMTNLGQVFGQ